MFSLRWSELQTWQLEESTREGNSCKSLQALFNKGTNHYQPIRSSLELSSPSIVVSQNKPQYRPPNAIVLTVRTPKKVPLILNPSPPIVVMMVGLKSRARLRSLGLLSRLGATALVAFVVAAPGWAVAVPRRAALLGCC